MEKQGHIQAYLKALWEKPANLLLILLDLAGLVAVVAIVVDDWMEASLVLVFLGVWVYSIYLIFKQKRETITGLEEHIAELQSDTVVNQSKFQKAQRMMPKLLAEMREDLASDETQLVREFFVSPTKGAVFSSREPRFRYNADEHDNLHGKIGLLEEYGFVVHMGASLYRMTEEFVHLLTGANEAA
jgi:hypothetical protein